jgi:8-oxo-dGTP pyrophosphatase MutT (NUDIX family)
LNEIVIRKARVILIDQDFKLLLISHKPDSDEQQYYIPVGGSVENNETTLQAAKREVYEETGYKCIENPTYIGEGQHSFRQNLVSIVHQVDWFYLQVKNFTLSMDNFTDDEKDNVIDIGWFDLDELSNKSIIFAPRNLLEIVEEIKLTGKTAINKVLH